MRDSLSTAIQPMHQLCPLVAVLLAAVGLPILLYTLIYPAIHTGSSRYLVIIVTTVLVVGVVLWALRRDHIPHSDLGLTFGGAKEALVIAGLGWTGVILLQTVITGPYEHIAFSDPASLLQQWLFVGMVEELIYRGYFLNWFLHQLKRLLPAWQISVAVIITNILFAGAHLPAGLSRQWQSDVVRGNAGELFSYLGLVFLVGIGYSYVYLRTRNIFLTGLLHGGWNVPLIDLTGRVVPILLFVGLIEITMFIRGKVRGQSKTHAGRF